MIILLCLLENFLKNNNFLKQYNNELTNINMMKNIRDNRLDIISFCKSRNCYNDVCTIIYNRMCNENNKIQQTNQTNQTNQLN